mmetsp:Transcript_37534/g.82322  ORF Transcript_37534/g.82322 Transcript_37534/m.82322 type:complete len:210 (+) Transcript_37534:88-717(+)|eukprot:CAMPEP_0170616028 /NCGR_PEP_ID=MMETSP0224-20130122/25654_1 /TAXON_ID=285029 /ORGANISM="Togula jolla, Strain CCCM 725" /LENGTH=209 /DNA_ID=CAMNT_0010941803 /DNA_START=87 /DNA_END=716 /DNA_ORIENTATION=+
MALLLSPARRMRVSSLMRSAEHLSGYSESGNWSTFSFRQRYTVLLKYQTDPTIADYFYEKFLHAWVGDVPSYNYWWVSSFAAGAAFGILYRHWFFNPDIYGRKQENKKKLPDRHRQWSYSLPYFNHRLRNCVTPYKWSMIDNEPDYADHHPLGYRPNRKMHHKRVGLWCFTVPRYAIEDPLFTSVSHSNMCQMYEEIGYTKKAHAEDED